MSFHLVNHPHQQFIIHLSNLVHYIKGERSILIIAALGPDIISFLRYIRVISTFTGVFALKKA